MSKVKVKTEKYKDTSILFGNSTLPIVIFDSNGESLIEKEVWDVIAKCGYELADIALVEISEENTNVPTGTKTTKK